MNTVDKKHFISLYKSARERLLIKRNIMIRWTVTGLFLFNLERVLQHTLKFTSELTVLKANDMLSCSQDQVLQMSVMFVTSVTIEALILLHNLIKQKLDESNTNCIQRHIQKLASTVKISFVKQTLFQNQNWFLFKINNEVKVHHLIRSVILEKVKVMSYENLEKTWAKHAVKKKAITGKGKCNSKHKSSTPESEPEVQMNLSKIVTDLSVSKNKVMRMSEVELVKTLEVSWRASVAWIY